MDEFGRIGKFITFSSDLVI